MRRETSAEMTSVHDRRNGEQPKHLGLKPTTFDVESHGPGKEKVQFNVILV